MTAPGAPSAAGSRRHLGLRRAALATAVGLSMVIVGAFLALPIVALITYQPIGRLLHGFGAGVATDAILVSLKTNAIAFALMLGFGTPFA